MSERPIYKLVALQNETVLQVYGTIGKLQNMFGETSDGFTLKAFQDATANIRTGVLTIEINSPGGSIVEALALYDAMRQLSIKTKARIYGQCASAATVFACGADEVEGSENIDYLVHNTSTFEQGNKEKMKETQEELERYDNKMIAIYHKKTGKPKDALAELMKKDKPLTAQEALEWGFIDRIIIDNKLKLAAMAQNEEEKEKDKEAKVEEKVESYLKAGKIKAETKKAWMQIGLADYDTMTATLDNIQVVINPDLNKVPDTEKPVAYATKDEAFTAYKEGKIKTLKELEELTKTMEG